MRAKDWSALALLTALAAALRVAGANRDLWIDEIVTVVRYMRLPPLQTLAAYASPNQHLLNSFFGGISIALLGEHAWSVRLPALLFGIATPAAVYLFVRTVGSRREALLTALLLALSYHHVWFSQNARGYAAMIFWVTVANWLLIRAVERGGRHAWAGYVLCMIAGAGFLVTTAFVALGNSLALIVYSRCGAGDVRGRRVLRRAALASLILIGAGVLLLHVAVLDDMVRFFAEEERVGLGSGIGGLGGFIGLLIEGLGRGFGVAGVALLGAIVLLAAGAYETWRRQPLLVLLFAGPPLFGIAAILLLSYGAYPRAFLYLLPLALLFFVRGCEPLARLLLHAVPRAGGDRDQSILRLRITRMVTGLLVLLSAVSLAFNYRYPKQDYRGALRWVHGQAGEGDAIAAAGMAAFAYTEYYGPDVLAIDSLQELETARRESATVWVLYSFPRDMRLRFDELYEVIERDGELRARLPGTLSDGALYVSAIRGDRPSATQ